MKPTRRSHRWRLAVGAVLVPLLVSAVTFAVQGSSPPLAPELTVPPPDYGPGDPVIMAAGDIACDPGDGSFNGGNGTANSCRQKYTAQLLADADAVLPLGDEQYEKGTLSAFNQSYDPSWGQYKAITRPAAGNHEYQTIGGAGYYGYFGDVASEAGKGYYSWDFGTWHLIALNAELSMGVGLAEYTWLENDLQNHPNECVLAYWHEPRFKAAKSPVAKTKPIWDLLYRYNADVILNGHVHNYQRLKPLDPNGNVDSARGIREFIVGTGGKGHGALLSDPKVEATQNKIFGVLKMTLHDGSYDWQFVPEAGKTYNDSGTGTCH